MAVIAVISHAYWKKNNTATIHLLCLITQGHWSLSFSALFKYKVRAGELQSRTLNLSVWHAEPLGRNIFLGEVEVALGLWDWTCTQPLWQDLQPRVSTLMTGIDVNSYSVRSSIACAKPPSGIITKRLWSLHLHLFCSCRFDSFVRDEAGRSVWGGWGEAKTRCEF